jgi:hypothetical protein
VRPSLEPETPAEFQALAVLVSAADLAEEIDALRRQMAEPDSARRKQILASRLIEAAERLINLLALLQRRSHEYGAGFAARIDEQIAKLRQRLLGSTRELVIERARRVTRRALEVLDGSAGYPLGLAGKLREMLTGIEMTIDVLGGLDVLSDGERTVIADAGASLARLAAREAVLDLMETA